MCCRRLAKKRVPPRWVKHTAHGGRWQMRAMTENWAGHRAGLTLIFWGI